MEEPQYRLGLVFSGGGARVIAQAGVLQALEENNIQPHVISSTSSGAIIALMYAAGYTPYDILGYSRDHKLMDFLSLSFSPKGLFKNQKLAKEMISLFKVEKVNQLRLPVHVTCTNITDMQQMDLKDERIHTALQATLSLPIFFRPLRCQGKLLVDGGLTSNLPVEPLVGKCRKILGVHVNPRETGEFSGFREYVMRIMKTALYANVDKNRHLCDWVLEPEALADYPLMNFSGKEEEIFNIGYEDALRFLAQAGSSL